MSPADRAKQFMPFAALKGYEEALRKKEKITVPKIILTEDSQEILNSKLQQVKIGDIITAVYYKDGEYIELTGMVSKIDTTFRFIKIVNTTIPLDELYDINAPWLSDFFADTQE
jgi:hypothetical protein